MNITKKQLKQIIKEELEETMGHPPGGHGMVSNIAPAEKKALDMLNQAANLISDVADAVAMQGNDDLKRQMHSMVDEIHRQFGSHEDEEAGI